MGIRDTYPILARKTQLGGPAPRKYTVNADEFDLLVDLVDTLTSAVVSATGITALTGDASAAGTGTVVATVNQARGLRETAGPTTLTMGAVADGEMLIRDGATVRGEPVPTGGTGTEIVDGDFAGSYEGMLYRTGASAYEARRFAVSASAPSPSDDEAAGYKAGSIWIQTDGGAPTWIWVSLGDGGWKRMGSGESNLAGLITTVLTGSSAYDHNPDFNEVSALSIHVPSGGKTVNLPDLSGGGAFLTFFSKVSGAAGDTITLHPQTGQSINGVTGDHVLPGSGRAIGSNEAFPMWIVVSIGGTWVIFGGPLVEALESTLTADGNLPDAEVVLLDTSAGPIDVQLPAVVTNRPRVWTLKIITTDGNGATFVPAASETIEGAAASLLMPSSDSGDLVSCTIFRARSGNWWIL